MAPVGPPSSPARITLGFPTFVLPGVVVRECTPEDDEAVLNLIAAVAEEGAAQQPAAARAEAAWALAHGTATVGLFLDGQLIGIDQMRPGPEFWHNAWFAILPEFRRRFSARFSARAPDGRRQWAALGQELTARYWDLGMRKTLTRAAVARPEIAAGLGRRGWRLVAASNGWQTFAKEWRERPVPPAPHYELHRLRPASPGEGWSHIA